MSNLRKFLFLLICLAIAALIYQRGIEVEVPKGGFSDVDSAPTQHRISAKSYAGKERAMKPGEAASPKIIGVPTLKRSPLDPEIHELLCKLKAAHTSVPTQGKVQVYVSRMTPLSAADAYNVAWIKSDSCPEGLYSIVHFTDDSSVSQEIDCRRATLAEIAAVSGEQGNISDTPIKDGETNLAISGNGYFVLSCPRGRMILTRDGRFQQGPSGDLTDKEGCTLLNQQGSAFKGFDIDQAGCNTTGDCVATVEPAFDRVAGLEYINSFSFEVAAVGDLSESVTKRWPGVLRPSFFEGALEDVHNPARGLTSVSWRNHPHINLSDFDCP